MSEDHNVQPAASSPVPGIGEVIAGKYRIESTVGEGGMGVVLAARHLQLGQTVALKLLRPELADSADTVARFVREAKAAAVLESDHVVRIYDVGTLESGAPFMVMELLRGVDLRTVLDQHAMIPVDRAVEYLLQACSAIAAAHAAGIVHRDLKPSNLFLAKRSDGTPLIKVLDFGISKALDPVGNGNVDLTSTNAMVGSPKYMAPEQIRDARRVDTRADLWALGVLLHEMLAGGPPFEADSMTAMCATIAADEPASTRAANPEVPVELEAVILRCLEKNPDRRYQNVAELVAALRPFSKRPPASFAMPQLQMDATLPSSTGEQATLAVNPPTPTVASVPAVERTRSALVASQGGVEPRKRRQLQIVGGLLLVAAAVAVAVAAPWRARQTPNAPTSLPTAAPVKRAGFTLSIDSAPTGATVLEGDRVLGKTPATIAMDNAALGRSPRRFTLRLGGFLPYDVAQGASTADVRVLATLAAEPSASATEAPARAPKAVPALPRHAVPRASAPAPDIQLQR